jgi:hypothetical protein
MHTLYVVGVKGVGLGLPISKKTPKALLALNDFVTRRML